MDGGVVDVGRPDEAPVADEPVLDLALVEQSQHSFQADFPVGVMSGQPPGT